VFLRDARHPDSRQKRTRKPIVRVTFLLCLFIFSQYGYAKRPSSERIQSLLIYKLATLVEWSNIENIKTFHIGVVGKNQKLLAELILASRVIKVHGRSVQVATVDPDSVSGNQFQIIFVNQNVRRKVSQLAKRIRHTDTLLVSRGSKARDAFMFNFIVKNKKIYFEVNRDNLLSERLVVDDALMSLGLCLNCSE